MEWTRSPWMRAIGGISAVALVVLYREERNGFFWLGVVLVVMGAVRLAVRLRRAPSPAGESARTASTREPEEHQSWLLLDLLDTPAVARALDDAPDRWQQVAYFDHEFDDALPSELAEFIWVDRDGDWSFAVGDELKPFLDLEVPEEDDAIIRVLRAHPDVVDARHEDREVYEVESRGSFDVAAFAELVLRALTAGQVDAVSRLDPST